MAAAVEPVNQELALKRMFAAIKPRLTRSDLSDSRRRDDLVRVVHEAAYACSSYREVATFVRNALCALDRSNTWSVVVAKDMYLRAKKREGETSLLSVPALLRDVVALCHSAKSLDEVSAVAAATARSHLLSFSVLAFKAGSDEADAAGRLEAMRAPPAPGAVGPSGYGGISAPLPLEAEVLKAHLGEVRLQGGAEGSDASTAAASSEKEDAAAAGAGSGARKRKGAASASSVSASAAASPSDALASVLRTVGALQRQVTGLDASSEGAFCNALSAALTADYGSTWHIVLSPAAHKGSKQPIATATPKKADAPAAGGAAPAADAASAVAASGDGKTPAAGATAAAQSPAQRYSLGGLVSASLMRDIIMSPAHAAGYDVVFETTPREASLAPVSSTNGSAAAAGADAAASGSADGGTGSELVQRGQGARRDAPAAEAGAAGTVRSRLEVRYLEMTLRSCPPPAPAAATGASGSASSVSALDQNPLRDSAPASAAAAPAAPASAAASAASASVQQQPEYYTLTVFRTGFAFLQAADGPGVADGTIPLLPSGSLSVSATPTLLPTTAAVPGAKTAAALAPPARRARVCFGYFDSWGDLMSRARWALLFAGLTAVVFFVGAYMNARDTHCIRPGHAVPFVPALGLMASTLMPQPLSSMFGRRLLPMLGHDVAAVAPHLFPGDVVPSDVLAAAGFASAASAAGDVGAASAAAAASVAADASSVGEFASAAAAALADAAAAAVAAEPMGAGGCTLRESILAEIASGQSWAVLYIGLTAFALMSALRWTRKGYDRARVTAVLRSVSETSAGMGTAPAAAGAAGRAPAAAPSAAKGKAAGKRR